MTVSILNLFVVNCSKIVKKLVKEFFEDYYYKQFLNIFLKISKAFFDNLFTSLQAKY